MIHPVLWPDIIIAVLIAEGLFHSIRSVLHYVSHRNRNQQQLGPQQLAIQVGALDTYRYSQERGERAPLG